MFSQLYLLLTKSCNGMICTQRNFITNAMAMMLATALVSYAQTDSNSTSNSKGISTVREITTLNRMIGGKLIITTQPSLIEYGCAKIDIEYRPIINSKSLSNWSYMLSPEIYLGSVSRGVIPEHLLIGINSQQSINTSGWGVSGMVRYYFDSVYKSQNDYDIVQNLFPYVFGCAGYQNVDLTYSAMAWIRDNNTSIPTYNLVNTEIINGTKQFYVFIGFGVMATVAPIFVFDAYATYGPRFGSQKPSALPNKAYEDVYFTGRGWMISGGFRMGIML